MREREMMIRLRLIAILLVVIGMISFPAVAKDLASAKKHLEQATIEAEEMVVHLQEGHVGIFKEHAARFLKHASEALDEMPMENSRAEEWVGHLQAAISEAEKAVKSAEGGKQNTAEDHALAALSHAEEVYSIGESF